MVMIDDGWAKVGHGKDLGKVWAGFAELASLEACRIATLAFNVILFSVNYVYSRYIREKRTEQCFLIPD